MKAVAYYESLPIDHVHALVDVELATPTPTAHQLLVEVKAISVNPVDTKVRRNTAPAQGSAKVLGWDAAGIVTAVGEEVSLFKIGDRVWYAGSIAEQGTNSEFHCVDERIVGHMPQQLSFAEAAALPLTALTAWELLFDRLAVKRDDPNAYVMIIGAAGGVGSVMVQLVKQLTQLKVIATASRPDSVAWLNKLGADMVIDHTKSMLPQLANIPAFDQALGGRHQIDYIISLNKTDQHYETIVEAIKPQGKFALIDDPGLLDFRLLKRKSVSLHWELMFTRALFRTDDMIEQHRILEKVANMVDQGKIVTTLNHHLGVINAAHLKQAHAMLENSRAAGKIVLEGF